MTSTTNNMNEAAIVTNTDKNISKKFTIAKIIVGASLLLALMMSFIGLTSQRSYAATNTSYIASIIQANFGGYAGQAMNIARCESGYNPAAVNSEAIGGSHAEGLFQILYPSTWSTTSSRGASPFDPSANAHAAHEIFQRDGNSWREWQCQP